MALRPALGGEGCGDLPCWVVVGAISCASLTSASRTTPVMLSVWPLSEVNVFSFTPQRSLPHQQSRATWSASLVHSGQGHILSPREKSNPTPASHWVAREHDLMSLGLSFSIWKVGSLQCGQG